MRSQEATLGDEGTITGVGRSNRGTFTCLLPKERKKNSQASVMPISIGLMIDNREHRDRHGSQSRLGLTGSGISQDVLLTI
jgi:hypothetical protein